MPRTAIVKIKEKLRVKIYAWISAYIAETSPLFEEGMKNNYLVRRRNGDVWQRDYWKAGMGIVDFINPGARKWYTSYMNRFIDLGVDAFKTDFSEDVPYIDSQFYDGSDPTRMHGLFSLLYKDTVLDTLQSCFGIGKAYLFSRSATAGSQRLSVHCAGNSESTVETMAGTLRAGLSIAASGFSFWSHDIGGSEENTSCNRHTLYKSIHAVGSVRDALNPLPTARLRDLPPSKPL